eukprot:scaffold76205_cov59-Phaeocystis_antarctica.AAC.2
MAILTMAPVRAAAWPARLEVASGDELHDEIDAGLAVVDVEQLDDVRVVDALEDLDLVRVRVEVRVRVRVRVRVGVWVRARVRLRVGIRVKVRVRVRVGVRVRVSRASELSSRKSSCSWRFFSMILMATLVKG